LADLDKIRAFGGFMPLVQIVLTLALVQFLFFCFAVGKARGTYKVAAPATTGNEMFERYFRVQMNTLELLVIFIPSTLISAQYFGAYVVAGLGVIYLIGRMIYFTNYVKDPKSRSMGYGLSALPVLVLLAGALVGAVRAAIVTM
jgi:glutathione S-transferase